ncbi:MAG: TOMM precursor leader peptide-binding protein [Firmicutes bacterium]|nr:TOMM precursor leader peptide-binding protein [Bacillota bacterium]
MTDTGGLPSKPRVPGFFNVLPMEGDRIQLRSAHRTVILSGSSVKAVARLLDLLDGTRDVRQVLACFPEIPAVEVLRTLRMLYERRLIEDAAVPAPGVAPETPAAPPAPGGAGRTFFSMVFGNGQIALDVLKASRVVVFGLGRVGSHAVASLARAGVGNMTVVDDGVVDPSLHECGGLYSPADTGRPRAEVACERMAASGACARPEPAQVDLANIDRICACIRGADLVLVCQDHPAVSIYRAINAASLREGVRWLRTALDGFEAQLGPSVLPRDTACYTCYEKRVRGNWPHYDENLAFEEYLASGNAPADYGCLTPIAGFLGHVASIECLKLLTGFSYPSTSGKMWVFNVNTFEAKSHPILKLPRCPSCGSSAGTPVQAQWAL